MCETVARALVFGRRWGRARIDLATLLSICQCCASPAERMLVVARPDWKWAPLLRRSSRERRDFSLARSLRQSVSERGRRLAALGPTCAADGCTAAPKRPSTRCKCLMGWDANCIILSPRAHTFAVSVNPDPHFGYRQKIHVFWSARHTHNVIHSLASPGMVTLFTTSQLILLCMSRIPGAKLFFLNAGIQVSDCNNGGSFLMTGAFAPKPKCFSFKEICCPCIIFYVKPYWHRTSYKSYIQKNNIAPLYMLLK